MFNLYYDAFNNRHFVEENGTNKIHSNTVSFIRDFETEEEAKKYCKFYDAISEWIFNGMNDNAIFIGKFIRTTASNIKSLKFLGFSEKYELLFKDKDSSTYFYKLTNDEILIVDDIYGKAYTLMV